MVTLALAVVAQAIISLVGWLRWQTGEPFHLLAWSASGLALLATWLLRARVVDPGRLALALQSTNPLPPVPLRPQRYLDALLLAMGVGLVATIVIQFQFIAGMLIYLVMQICLIFAYSGIIHLRPADLRDQPQLRRVAVPTAIFWAISGPLLFIFLVYGGPRSLVTVPYVVALVLMAAVVCLGWAYRRRPAAFRLLAILGALSFVFSDTLIGHVAFANPESNLAPLISPTYILAILLLSLPLLAWPAVHRRQ